MSRGRPPKIDDEITIKRLLIGIRLGMPYEQAAAFAGIVRKTFYNWIEKGEKAKTGKYYDFLHKVKEAEYEGVATCLKSIHDAREGGNWQAAAWILERRYPDSYGRQRIEVTGKDGTSVKTQNIIDVSGLTNEQLEKLANLPGKNNAE